MLSKLPIDEKWKALASKYAAELLGPVRAAVWDMGWAIAIHGSCQRDIDLIALPWKFGAAGVDLVIPAIQQAAEKVCGKAELLPRPEGGEWPRHRPHGRRHWSFMLPGGPWIDLAVVGAP